MASIRDVAKEAGVAICTVSRLINGTANVEPETEKKIEDAMKKLDYVPNELARGMFKGRSNSIAMLVPNIQHPWFSSLASEIEKILYEKKYKFMLFSTSDDKQREKECFKLLKSNIVDGIICGTSACTAKEYQKIDKPMVMLDYKVGDKFPVVVSDHKMGGQLAAQEFINSGCKYVIHISGIKVDKNIMSFECHEELDRVLAENGIKSRRVPIQWNDFDFQGYFEMAKCILEEYPDVDGIFAADMPAIAFLKAALAIGKKIPDDLAIVAYDGTYITNASTTRLTSIHQPYREIAQEAVRQLMDMIDGPADEEQAEKEQTDEDQADEKQAEKKQADEDQADEKQADDEQADAQTGRKQPGITVADQTDSTGERNIIIDGNLVLLPVSVEKGDTTK